MLSLFNRKKRFRSLPEVLLTQSGGSAGDVFGYSVSLSNDGNTLIVGSPYDNFLNTDQGSATVFTRSGLEWTHQQTLLGPSAANSYFGWSVALSGDGNTAIIGANFETTGGVTNQGSARVFTRTGSLWSEVINITTGSGLYVGTSVCLSGDGTRLAVGAIGNGSTKLARVLVYRYDTSWVLEQTIVTPLDDDGKYFTNFGSAVSLSNDGSTLAIGSEAWDGGSGTGNDDTGAALVYTRSGTTWTQQKIINTIYDTGAFLGISIDLSSDGNTLLVGAPYSSTGRAAIWTRSGSTWTLQQTIERTSPAVFDHFGYSVALSGDGNTALIGAPRFSAGPLAITDEGCITVFTRLNSTWTKRETLLRTNAATGDRFGWSVALSGNGNIAIGGAPFDNVGANSDQGSATVFYRR